MRKIKLSILILTTFLISTVLVAQTDVFKRSAVIPCPAIENGGWGNIVAGLDLDNDGNKEIFAVNDNWNDSDGHEMIPTIYKFEWNSSTETWDSVWSTELDIPRQNTWPTLLTGDLDGDGKQEIIWSPINNFDTGNEIPARVVVFESVDGSDAMGILSGDLYLPNAQWEIVSDSNKNMRPFAAELADVDGDGTLEYIFSDRAPYLGVGVVSVDDIPDDGDGSETWTLEVSGIDTLNVKGVDTLATLTNMTSYMDLAVIGNTIYLFNKASEIMGLSFNGTDWEYLPVQTGLPSFNWNTAHVVDIDEDGTKEIIASSAWDDGMMKILKQEGDTLTTYDVANLGDAGAPNTMGSSVGDIDGDGNLDIIFGTRDSSPNRGGVIRVEWNGGSVTSEGSYDVTLIDEAILPYTKQIDLVTVANVDADDALEVIYTGIPRSIANGEPSPPIVVLDFEELTQTVTSIADVKVDADSNFLPDNVDQVFSIIGIVNSVNFTATSNRFSYNIEDATGGINITKGSEDGGGTVYEIGDRLLVTGTLGAFRGTSQLNLADVAADVTMLDGARNLFPTELTIAELLENAEMYEATLITLTGVAPTEGADAWPAADSDANITVWDGNPAMELTLRVDKDSDLDDNVAPTFPANITGVVTQYSFSEPANDGYQVSPSLYTGIEQEVIVAPSPYFALTAPVDGAVISISDSTSTFDITWEAAVDLNDDIAGYQFTVLPEILAVAAVEPTVTLSATEILDLMAGADTLTAEWTVLVLDGESLTASSIDTFTVTFTNDILVGVDDQAIPNRFYVDQNYPNPFNPTTTIKFGLPAKTMVSLRIYDVLGREVQTLVNNQALVAGTHSYNFDASRLASGTYIYRLTTDNNVVTKKMLLLK